MSRKHFNVFPAVTVKSQFPIPIQLLHCGQGFFLLSGILILPLLEKRPVKNNLSRISKASSSDILIKQEHNFLSFKRKNPFHESDMFA